MVTGGKKVSQTANFSLVQIDLPQQYPLQVWVASERTSLAECEG